MANVPISNMTVTWTDSGTTYNAVKMNVTDTASNAASLLMDLQVGGTSQFRVTKSGQITAIASASTYMFQADTATWAWSAAGFGGTAQAAIKAGSFQVANTGFFSFSSSSNANGTQDTLLVREAASTLVQRNATNPQTFRVYNTYTNSTDNYERGFLKWATNILAIGTEKGSVGGTARALEFQTDGTTRLTISALGTITSAAGYVLQPASPLTWLTRGEIYFNADGVAMLRNNAGTDFGRLQFGGTTSSFPSLKRETNTLRVRLADDSADAQLIAGRLTSSSGIIENSTSFYTDSNGARTSQTGYFGFSSSALTAGAPDVYLYRDAANTLALRNTTNPQAFRIYGTTDGTNSEYLQLRAATSSGPYRIQTSSTGTGAARALQFGTAGIESWQIQATNNHLTAVTDNTYDIGASGANRPRDVYVANSITLGNAVIASGTISGTTVRTSTAYTVATLPAAGTAGRRAYVTDATAPTFLGALTGGGAVKCPVFDDGTAWVAG